MRIHLFYSALGLALVAGASAASAQTVIETVRTVEPATPMIVGHQVIKQTVVRRVASRRPIYDYAGPGRVVTKRAYTRRLYNVVTTRTFTRPIYDYVAPAPVVTAPVYSRPYYDAGYTRPYYDYDAAYSRPLYDTVRQRRWCRQISLRRLSPRRWCRQISLRRLSLRRSIAMSINGTVFW